MYFSSERLVLPLVFEGFLKLLMSVKLLMAQYGIAHV
jgi:hypothetical protein